MIPRIIMSIALAVAFAGPAVAQSYSGEGDRKRHWQCDRRAAARETNGRYGYGGTVAPRPGDSPSAYAVQGRSGISAYAYSPTARGSIDRHRRHSR